jgi:hypothetical protein
MKQYDGHHPTAKQAENKSPNSEAKNRGMLALANKGQTGHTYFIHHLHPIRLDD